VARSSSLDIELRIDFRSGCMRRRRTLVRLRKSVRLFVYLLGIANENDSILRGRADNVL